MLLKPPGDRIFLADLQCCKILDLDLDFGLGVLPGFLED